MAGNYPDYPNHRFAIDRDGTQGYYGSSVGGESSDALMVPDAVLGQFTTQQLEFLNNEGVSTEFTPSGAVRWIGLIFPELRDITNIMWRKFDGRSYKIQWSANTTNLIDGTWSTLIASATDYQDTNYRTGIKSGSQAGVRAIRILGLSNAGVHSPSLGNLHIFGTLASGENPDRLQIWHPTLDQRVSPAWFDWGDTPRNSSADKTFRVKNLSPTLTANTITLSTEALTDASPSVPGQHTLSNGGAFAATQAIASLAPGAISAVHTLRRTTPSNAALSLWALRLRATAASWT